MVGRAAARVPVGLFLSGADGGLSYVNERWCQMAGIPAAEALAGGWDAALHPDDRKRVAKVWRTIAGRPEERVEQFRFLRPGGEIVWVEASVSRLPDWGPGAGGLIGSCTDVTERKRLEARMRLYEGMFATTPDLAYVFNREHRFVYANRALLAMWGRTWEEAEGRSLLELGYPQWHAEMHEREIEEVYATGELRRGEVPFHGANGRRIYEYIFNPVFDEEGEVEAVAGTTRDVTERKQAEVRAGFLSLLAGRLAPLQSEPEIIRAAVEAVGEHLGCQRCCFVECPEAGNQVRVGKNWLRDAAMVSLEGVYSLEDCGGADGWGACADEGQVVDDVGDHPLPRALAAVFENLGVGSYALQPFKSKGGRAVMLLVTEGVPRKWSAEEMGSLEDAVARVWPLVEKTRAVEAMRESQERLALVADNIPAVVTLVGLDHRVRYANRYCREWYGFPRDPMEGAHLREVMGEEAYQFRQPFYERVMAGEVVKFEAPSWHKTLGRRDLSLVYTPDRGEDGAIRGFFVMGTDITERREAESAMKRQNEARRLLAEAGRVILTSDTLELMLRRMYATVSEFLQADLCLVLTPTVGGDGPRVEFSHGLPESLAIEIGRIYFGPDAEGGSLLPHRLAKAYRRARAVLEGEVRSYSCRPLLVGDELLGVMILASRRRGPFLPQEAEFLETLSQYITGAHVRLRLVESLRESDRRKDEFLATLAHELRNPLAPILTGLGVMRRMMGDPETTERVTEVIGRQAAQMVHLIDDLLDISRVNTGKIVLKKSEQSLRAILQSAVEASEPLIELHRHELELSLPPVDVLVEVDPARVAQVVSNLLSNAAKYTPPGGRVELEAGWEGADVWVRVRDNGLGVDPSEHEVIFELFRQTGNGIADGLGIGLTLVRSLVEQHGGRVEVRSEGRGRGSEFVLTLPGCVVGQDAGQQAQARGRQAGASRQPKQRVLVVDDGKSAADMLALFFRLEGMEVEVAYDGSQAVEKVREFRPDLVMMDLGMPVMNGMEAARLMRAEGFSGVLIALSGWGREEDKKRTVEAGFDSHVVKPVCPDDLRSIMRTWFPEAGPAPVRRVRRAG
jgi:PAS domain S-box-containing protein